MDAEAAVELVFWAYYYQDIGRKLAYDRLLTVRDDVGLSYWEGWLDQLDVLRQRQGRVSSYVQSRAA